MKEPMENKTIRFPSTLWNEIEKRSKNPSKFIRELLLDELTHDQIETARCCGTCELFKQHKHIDEYPDIILSGYCRAFGKETKIYRVCKKSYVAKEVEPWKEII